MVVIKKSNKRWLIPLCRWHFCRQKKKNQHSGSSKRIFIHLHMRHVTYLLCLRWKQYRTDLTQIYPAGKRGYIGIFAQGRSKLSELLAALLWFTALDGDLCTLRAVVNPVGTCLELANHLELKSAQMGGDKQAGGSVEWSQHILFPVVSRLLCWLRNTRSVH